MRLAALSTSVIAFVIAAFMAAATQASTEAAPAACPDPSRGPLGKPVGVRGYTACSDGATASAKVGGATYTFRGGVCWKDSTVQLNVDIGAIVNDRVKSDIPGFGIVDQRKGHPISDSVDIGTFQTGKVLVFRGPVTLTYKQGGRSATFKGKVLRTTNGKVAAGTISINGSFTCKRILVVPG